MSAVETGLSLRRSADLATGNAVSADITAAGWPDPDASIPPREEVEAAEHLVKLHRRHRCTLFEYYLTDKAGHGRLDVPAEDIVGTVDRFLGGIVDAMDPSSECLVITSDHGNIEDVSEKTHTRNPVPLIAWGRGASAFRHVTDLSGVTPAIEQLLHTHLAAPADS
jgi:bisphosphoglycerate-independent phosphoglycerate mutase (AlkP superfamily)